VVRWVGNLGNWDSDLGDRSSVNLGNGGNDLGDWDSSLHRLTANDGVESVVLIGGVFDHSAVAISINQSVLSDDVVTVTLLVLALDVSGMIIMHGVLELVLGRSIRIFDMFHGHRKYGSAGSSNNSEQDAVLELLESW
uniref:Uncharacterized protein n=1 Tax=Anopheles melas TaxID=34690 RepID=A0A182TXR2_9DIPT